VLIENLDIVQNWTDSYNGKFNFIQPDAGAMAFMRYSFNVNSTELVERIRDEQKFDNADHLVQQLKKDKSYCNQLLQKYL